MALTYAVLATGRGREANPAWSVFNEDPGAVWTAAGPQVAAGLAAAYALVRLALRYPLALRVCEALIAGAAAHRAAIVAHNICVLALGVNLLPVAG
jgi:transcriptional regulator GlxA family with amidase domain